VDDAEDTRPAVAVVLFNKGDVATNVTLKISGSGDCDAAMGETAILHSSSTWIGVSVGKGEGSAEW
jgi:hypothetical protein